MCAPLGRRLQIYCSNPERQYPLITVGTQKISCRILPALHRGNTPSRSHVGRGMNTDEFPAVRINGLGNLYNVQRSMDSAFSVIFMCSRVSEQCHDPVTDIARDDAIKAADSFATSIVISLHKLAQIFRIEQISPGRSIPQYRKKELSSADAHSLCPKRAPLLNPRIPWKQEELSAWTVIQWTSEGWRRMHRRICYGRSSLPRIAST
jgi:hypothetical protein